MGDVRAEDRGADTHSALKDRDKSYLWEVPLLPLLERSCSDCGKRWKDNKIILILYCFLGQTEQFKI